jgi:hypothetical protein
MIDPKTLDLNKLPKKFIDGAIGAHGKEGFSFVLTSGNELHSFMTTPTTMKSISEWMAKQIEAYEKQFGTINMTPPAIVSPLQSSDLGNK